MINLKIDDAARVLVVEMKGMISEIAYPVEPSWMISL